MSIKAFSATTAGADVNQAASDTAGTPADLTDVIVYIKYTVV